MKVIKRDRVALIRSNLSDDTSVEFVETIQELLEEGYTVASSSLSQYAREVTLVKIEMPVINNAIKIERKSFDYKAHIAAVKGIKSKMVDYYYGQVEGSPALKKQLMDILETIEEYHGNTVVESVYEVLDFREQKNLRWLIGHYTKELKRLGGNKDGL